jgi:glycosyltransferase involved in cell wall biosynthesis
MPRHDRRPHQIDIVKQHPRQVGPMQSKRPHSRKRSVEVLPELDREQDIARPPEGRDFPVAMPDGSIDKCLSYLIAGWAWDPATPNARLSVALVDGAGHIVTQFLASRFRQDLMDAGIGDGCHGFEFAPYGYSHRLTEPSLKFIVVETGNTVPFAPDAFEALPFPIEGPIGDAIAFDQTDQARTENRRILAAIDDIYNTLERQSPITALALNNLPSRLRPFIPHELDILFLIGLREGESKRYRVLNLMASLIRHGFRCGAYYEDEINFILGRPPRFRTLVIFRAALSTDIGALLAYARSIGARAVWDVDDYVFETRIIAQIDGIRFLSTEQKIKNAEGMRLYKQCLLAADHATTATEYLAERIRDCGQTATVIPNTLNEEQIAFASDDKDVRNPNVITFGFFAGTRTHDRDFLEVREPLLSIMRRRADTRLVVVGHFDIESDPDFRAFGMRVEKIDFVPFIKMLDILKYIDIILVPLELSTYCHAKSELKFFEAGLVSCVTIASATDTYRRAITNGVDGFICSTKKEWAATLDLLWRSPGLRREIGTAARRTALTSYVADRFIDRMTEAYGLPLITRSCSIGVETPKIDQVAGVLPKLSRGSRGAMLLPDMLFGGGGHRKALLLASAVAAAGINLELIFMNSSHTSDRLRDIINGAYYPFDNPIRLFNGAFIGYDWLIATSWATAYKIIELGFPRERVIYFVQDFEPLFSPMGSDFIRAEATYLAGFRMVALGNWCAEYLRERYGVAVESLRFPIERAIYNVKYQCSRTRRILFFAKPEMARRCFEIGTEALGIFHELCPDVEICLFGSTAIRQMSLSFPHTDLGVVNNLADLAELYASSMLGIAFSTTNPSLVGYEMLACGCPVVDFDRPDTSKVYGEARLGVVRVRPFSLEIANMLSKLVTNPNVLLKHQTHAPSLVASMPTDTELAAAFVDIVDGLMSANVAASPTAPTPDTISGGSRRNRRSRT